MSAMSKIFLGIEKEYKENELDKPKRTGHAGACQQSCRNGNKNSNSNDVVNEVFLRRVNVPAVPLLKTSYLQLESYFKRSDVQFCFKECARGVRYRVLQRATRICRYFLCSSLFGAIEEMKSSLVAYGVPCGFLDLDCDSHSIGKNANTLWKSKTIIWKVQMGVCGTKTFESDTRAIIGLEPAKRAVEKHSSDLLAVSERNVDLKRIFTSGDCWSCASVAGDGTETISVQCTSRRFGTILLC